MEKFVLALDAVVALLLPIGIYCLLLASINRRARPIMVAGAWDAVALLFAASGFLLITAPILLTEFYRRVVDSAADEPVLGIWARQWWLIIAYYLAVVSGSGWLILSRSHKTMIFNVDVELFPKVLERTLAQLGLESNRSGSRLVATPMKLALADGNTAFMATTPEPRNEATDRRHAELEIDAFSAMCHVTLHWGRRTPNIREEIEAELYKSLENAAPLENSVAGWFLSVSGLILGAVTAIALALMLLALFPHR